MLGVHQLVMRPIVLAGIPQPHLQIRLPNWLLYPVLLVWMVIILRLFPKILGSVGLLGNTSMNINRVLQHVKKAGGTFSGCKMDICVPEVVAVGHCCTYEGRYPEDRKVQKIIDWPDCNTLTEVRGFLGICGIVRIWVKDFARRKKPLVLLTKKDTEFVWGTDQKASMEDLKQVIVTAPCLCPINYHTDRCVILAINSSCIATGFILSQLCMDDKRYPSHFGSITWNERESCYSQAKIKI